MVGAPYITMKHSAFLKSAAVISFGGLIAKGIGALYRIPLGNVLGGYGMGLYQMTYPFFCLLLTFSSAGIPSAFSRIIARETARGQAHSGTLKAALKMFALLGLCGSILMCAFAPYMSALQGDKGLVGCYLALAPSVFLVALIAVYRGYFQGRNDMAPTAVSEIVEQVIKAAAGLCFAYRFSNDPARAVVWTLFAVTLSELAALIFLLMRYSRVRERRTLIARRTTGSEILFSALPVMAAVAVLPISQMADSVILVRLLAKHTASAVALYGLYTGGAVALVNLPATVCYGFVAAAVPAVSRACAQGDTEEGRRRALAALAFTVLLSAPCAFALFFFTRPVAALIFPSLPPEDMAVLVRLTKLSAVSAVTIASVDTLAACLAGLGLAKRAAFSMLVAVGAKLCLQFVLVSSPAFSVEGAAIASNACYLVAFCLDLFYTVKETRKAGERVHDNDHRTGDGEGRLDGARENGAAGGGQGALAHRDAPLGRKLKRGGDLI